MATTSEEIFKKFKDHSIAEFFKKNRQMLGYSGQVRSLTTIVHEYVTNSLDACEEAGILPSIKVEIKEVGEKRYKISVEDNGPGIPEEFVGRALAHMLSGTKFNRYMQQRGQQGIGASGCTLYALLTTGKPIKVTSGTEKGVYECELTIDLKSNQPIILNKKNLDINFRGLRVEGEFGDLKYEKSSHGPEEYLKRTALANPHAEIELTTPEGNKIFWPRIINEIPKRPKEIKPHPLGIEVHDLLDMARRSDQRKLRSFLVNSLSRMSNEKVNELQTKVDFSLDKDPKELTWEEAEKIVKAFKQMKFIAPELDSVIGIGKEQIERSLKNIYAPEFVVAEERKPKVFRGGIPFMVEAGIAYGGGAGRKEGDLVKAEILRFANRVPLLFDGSVCAITQAIRSVAWQRYGIKDFENSPLVVFVNLSSVFVPYQSTGKQAVSEEEEIIDEIKLALMDVARKLQVFLHKRSYAREAESKKKTLLKYVTQLSQDLGYLTKENPEKIEKQIREIIEKRYKQVEMDSAGFEPAASSSQRRRSTIEL